MSPTKRLSTIEEVASAAGVSVATVSRALRGLPNVAPSTRARVEEIAARLHYRADPSASRLARGRTTTVAMAVPYVDTWYFAQLMAGAEAVLSDAGYDLLLFAIGTEPKRRSVVSGPLVKRADGLIFASLRIAESEVSALTASGVRVATIGVRVPGAAMVLVDDLAIGQAATEHLLELGHVRVALISGLSPAPLSTPVPELRRQGYLDALAARGLGARPEYEAAGNFSIDGGAEAMSRLLDLPEPPTAVFAMSDEMAFGALKALRDRGLRVPDDMSIIGVDDHELSSVFAVTTINQAVEEHGAVAARLVLDQLGDGSPAPSPHEVATRLVVRGSTTTLGR